MTASTSDGWIGVDFDGTLVKRSSAWNEIGEPIWPMLRRVWRWRAQGRDVRLFTARANSPSELGPVREWMQTWLGEVLPITCTKDYLMCALFDDLAVSVAQDQGECVVAEGNSTAGLLGWGGGADGPLGRGRIQPRAEINPEES